jgi:hypothetical protein
MPTAKHYELSDWVDYVRRTGPPERLAAMERHLTVDRCERCAELAAMMDSVYGAVHDLNAIAVPEHTLRRAEQIFTPATAAPAWWNLPALAGEWMRENLLPGGEPGFALAGVRNAGVQRQRVFQAGSKQLRIDMELSSEGTRTVVGVLVDLHDPTRDFTGRPVFLVSGLETVAQAHASEFGEFELPVPAQRRVRLVMPFPESGERLEAEIAE